MSTEDLVIFSAVIYLLLYFASWLTGVILFLILKAYLLRSAMKDMSVEEFTKSELVGTSGPLIQWTVKWYERIGRFFQVIFWMLIGPVIVFVVLIFLWEWFGS